MGTGSPHADHRETRVGAVTCTAHWGRRVFAAVLLALSVLLSQSARADVFARRLSPYEQETVRLVLADSKRELASDPGGKEVEAIEVVTLDVFEPRDPAPQFLNWLHATTQKEVIRREILLREGAPYDASLAAESERNLRLFPQLSIVLLVPLKGRDPNKVRVLVITKDVWSLRVSWQPSFVNGKLTSLSLAPAESNLFGTRQTVMASLYLDPHNYWLGGRYFVPRVGDSHLRANVGVNAIFNCLSNNLEGASGDFTYGQPLVSSLTRWSWQTSVSWSSRVVRGLVSRAGQSVCSAGRPADLRYPTTPNELSGEPGSQVLQRNELLFPSEYRAERMLGQMVVTRSFNLRNKINLSSGAELDWRTYSRSPQSLDETPRQRVAYQEQPNGTFGERSVLQELPPDADEFEAAQNAYLNTQNFFRRDRRISPYAQLHAYSNTYLRVFNYETLGLQEDVHVGHDVYLRLYPAFQPLSSRDLLGVFSSASYGAPLAGGFAKVLAASSVEYSEPTRSDVSARLAAHYATRDVGLGRFVYDTGFIHQPVQYLSGYLTLDGTNRLRGYRPGALLGPGRVTFNHEFRSRPLRMFSILTGLSLFHDVGTVFGQGYSGAKLRQGAGVGLRVLLPQLDRDVFRIDFGFPLSRDPAAEFTFVATFGQAFATPASLPAVLLPQ
jgi:hypothetical protein